MATPSVPDHAAAINAMLTRGIGMYDLALLVGMSLDQLEVSLGSVTPLRGSQTRGKVYELLPALQAVTANKAVDVEDIEAVIMKMKPASMPPALQREFWAGQNSKLDYQKAVGDLWFTDRVLMLVTRLLRVQRELGLLMGDRIEREAGLTEQQARVMRGLIDSAFEEAKEAIRKEFADWDGSVDQPDKEPHKP